MYSCYELYNISAKILFYGPKPSMHYFAKTYLGDNYLIKKKSIAFYLLSFLIKKQISYNFIVAELPSFINFVLSSFIDITIPAGLKCNISTNINQCGISHSLREDLRCIQKQTYKFENFHTNEKLKFFYNELYLPYIYMRYGKTTIPKKLRQLKRILKKGKLTLMFNHDELLGGMLISDQGSVPQIHCACGNATSVAADGKTTGHVITALFHHFIKTSQQQGYPEVSLGWSRPFIFDGLYRFKKKWRFRILKSASSSFFIRFSQTDKQTRELLKQHPFIFKDNDSYSLAIFENDFSQLGYKPHLNEITRYWHYDFCLNKMEYKVSKKEF